MHNCCCRSDEAGKVKFGFGGLAPGAGPFAVGANGFKCYGLHGLFLRFAIYGPIVHSLWKLIVTAG